MSEDIHASSIRTFCILKDNIALCYDNNIKNNYSLYILGSVEVNGTQVQVGQEYNWAYNQSVDYEIKGNYDSSKIEVITDLKSSNIPRMAIIENGILTMIGHTQTYSGSIQVYYSNGWRAKALTDIEYNGVVYQSGDEIKTWGYNDYVNDVYTIF